MSETEKAASWWARLAHRLNRSAPKNAKRPCRIALNAWGRGLKSSRTSPEPEPAEGASSVNPLARTLHSRMPWSVENQLLRSRYGS